MTPKFKTATIASALCLSLAAMATPASATIVLAKASDFQGEIVLIDGAVGDTGSTILGHTNITHVGVTYDGNGETLEVLGTGQSQLSGDGDGLLNGMSYYLTDGGLFDLGAPTNQLLGCRGGWLRLVGQGPPVLNAPITG